MHFGIRDLLQVTVFVSLFALILAMPVALGIAIFLSQYAPRRPQGRWPIWSTCWPRCRRSSTASGPVRAGTAIAADRHLAQRARGPVLPVRYGQRVGGRRGTIFTGGIVLAVMILPIITAVTREVFVQTPQGQIEAALALGATRWEVVKTTVLPFGRSGYISGAMLGWPCAG
ncbi:binding--dependent transport system inner membrane component family protein [Mycobacterium xenopi 4042]|uniref:Binding--dependent transport system inner membrane component family protein n=1 Tax=Mycobacterium xenopi 4042 TaxID=1299334 RepID=X7ZVY4_MYCXE|nr:binding--dependent transport system inner membrane component family protein [Mycobacterium xenopi 4042]